MNDLIEQIIEKFSRLDVDARIHELDYTNSGQWRLWEEKGQYDGWEPNYVYVSDQRAEDLYASRFERLLAPLAEARVDVRLLDFVRAGGVVYAVAMSRGDWVDYQPSKLHAIDAALTEMPKDE
jgi:hypothetical protein